MNLKRYLKKVQQDELSYWFCVSIALLITLAVGLECGYSIGRNSRHSKYHGVSQQMEYHRGGK